MVPLLKKRIGKGCFFGPFRPLPRKGLNNLKRGVKNGKGREEPERGT
jgi:hypothetical protein